MFALWKMSVPGNFPDDFTQSWRLCTGPRRRVFHCLHLSTSLVLWMVLAFPQWSSSGSWNYCSPLRMGQGACSDFLCHAVVCLCVLEGSSASAELEWPSFERFLRDNWCRGCVVLGSVIVWQQQDVHACYQQELINLCSGRACCIWGKISLFLKCLYEEGPVICLNTAEKSCLTVVLFLWASFCVLLSILRKPQCHRVYMQQEDGIPPCKSCCK